MDFDTAFQRLIGHEGGYVNDPRDPGGETKFGISQRSYPGEDIPGLTLERAKAIYRRDFWGPAGCDAVPDGIKFDLFDMAVNSGVKPAVRTLQRAAGLAERSVDGVLGPQTLRAVQAMPPAWLTARFNGARLAFMADLTNWPAFSRGWAKRIAANLMEV
jgi:lysozyme family protein